MLNEVAELLDDDRRDAFIDEVADAMIALSEYAWDGSLAVAPHGVYGDCYSLTLGTSGAVIVFRRVDARDGEGHLLAIHLRPLTVELPAAAGNHE
jgi:hypothetical protein